MHQRAVGDVYIVCNDSIFTAERGIAIWTESLQSICSLASGWVAESTAQMDVGCHLYLIYPTLCVWHRPTIPLPHQLQAP